MFPFTANCGISTNKVIKYICVVLFSKRKKLTIKPNTSLQCFTPIKSELFEILFDLFFRKIQKIRCWKIQVLLRSLKFIWIIEPMNGLRCELFPLLNSQRLWAQIDNLILYEFLKQDDAFSLLSQKLHKIFAYFTAIQCGTKMLTLQESCWLKQLALDHFKQYIFTECWPYLKNYYKDYIPTSQRSCKFLAIDAVFLN